jgi:putative DNA primase/helicase
MIDNAWSELGIPVLPEDLDTKAWLLNCTNGTLDLKTGILRPHDRTDLLTRCISVAYDPKAACPTWEKFLWRIMGGTVTPEDPDMRMGELEVRQQADIRARALIDFLQRAIGHSLTGDTREQCLFIFWGRGANGKSTLINTLLTLLGPYAMKATAALLMVTRNDRHPTERADLFGTRFVAAIETEEGGRLNEVFVKEATGGDPIRARRMREDFWQFDPTHKVFLATNHKPVIRGTDHAIWRRIKLVPFTIVLPDTEQDKQLPAKLHAELPGILAWAVRGCLAWQQNGLGEPDAVTQATAGYREEMDVFEGFLRDECHRLPGAQGKASELYDAYERWCNANDVEALSKRTFGLRLADSGFTPEKGTAGIRIWKGIGLPAKEEDVKRSGT